MTPSAWWRPVPLDGAAPPRASGRPHEESESSRTAFRLLLAFTFILVISPQSFVPGLGSLRLAFAAAAAATAVCLGDRFVRREPLSVRSKEIRLVALLVAWAAATLPFSSWPGGSASVLLDTYLKSVVVFWLLCNTVDTAERLRRVLWSLSLMSIPLAATAVRNYLAGAFVAGADRGEIARIEGYTAPLTTNPNDLALMLNLILPLSLALLLSSATTPRRVLLSATIALSVVAIFLTLSRGGFLTLAATTLAALGRRARGPVALGACAAIVAALLLMLLAPSAYVAHLRTIADIQADTTGSAQERWGDMVSAARYVALHPVVGSGLGMNTLALNEVRGTAWRMVHNVYLQYAADLGIPGLALFGMVFVSSLAGAVRAARVGTDAGGNREIAIIAEGIAISLVAFAVAAMFHPVGYHFYFYYVAALAVAVSRVAIAGSGERGSS